MIELTFSGAPYVARRDSAWQQGRQLVPHCSKLQYSIQRHGYFWYTDNVAGLISVQLHCFVRYILDYLKHRVDVCSDEYMEGKCLIVILADL